MYTEVRRRSQKFYLNIYENIKHFYKYYFQSLKCVENIHV